jgi:hypothetical protein
MLAYCGWSAKQKSVGSGEFTNGCQNCRTTVGRDSRKTAHVLARTSSNTAAITRVMARAENSLDLKIGRFAGTVTDSVLSTASPTAFLFPQRSATNSVGITKLSSICLNG